ncbi:MAG TPA: thiol:disulfide interchange protein DsbA/DsbL [Chromatiales bacterium]|nr:thiol:disulfide interchange protein DsbA/DsbL [Chromatiales bacterium]
MAVGRYSGLIGLLLMLAVPPVVLGTPADFHEGNHYQLVDPPQPVPPGGKVEVLEFFWYDCQTCFIIEPALRQWLDRNAGGIIFKRMPAITDERMIFLARAYYAAVALDVQDKVHGPLYVAINRHKRKLDSEQTLAIFFQEQGVRHQAFTNAFRSNFVAVKVRQARVLGQRYGIRGAPTVIVGGRYRLDSSMVRSAEEFIEVLDYLVKNQP